MSTPYHVIAYAHIYVCVFFLIEMAELPCKDLVDVFQDDQNDLESRASSSDKDSFDFDEEVGLHSDPGK